MSEYKNSHFVLEDFVKDELEPLNKWCLSNYQKGFFKDANMGGPKRSRLTTRFSFAAFPEEVFRVKEKIVEHLNIKDHLTPGFQDGVYCGIGFKNNIVVPHKNPLWHVGTYTFHCTLLSKRSESGGDFVVDGKTFSLNEGDVFCSDVSSKEHMFTQIMGNEPSIVWSFGFCLVDTDR